jgi:hypothetical protein
MVEVRLDKRNGRGKFPSAVVGGGDAGNRTRVQKSWTRTSTSVVGVRYLARRFVRRPSRQRASRCRDSRPLWLAYRCRQAALHTARHPFASTWRRRRRAWSPVGDHAFAYASLRSERKRVVGRCVKSRYFFGTCMVARFNEVRRLGLQSVPTPPLSKPIIPSTVLSIAHLVGNVNVGRAD